MASNLPSPSNKFPFVFITTSSLSTVTSWVQSFVRMLSGKIFHAWAENSITILLIRMPIIIWVHNLMFQLPYWGFQWFPIPRNLVSVFLVFLQHVVSNVLKFEDFMGVSIPFTFNWIVPCDVLWMLFQLKMYWNLKTSRASPFRSHSIRCSKFQNDASSFTFKTISHSTFTFSTQSEILPYFMFLG